MKQNHDCLVRFRVMIEVQRLGLSHSPRRAQKSMIFFPSVFLERSENLVRLLRYDDAKHHLIAPERGIKGAGAWLIDMRVLQYTLCHTHQYCSFLFFLFVLSLFLLY
jgi:hypothetical protein